MTGEARIKLIGNNVAAINAYIDSLRQVVEKTGVTMRGPVPLPTKKLKLTVRKTPTGRGKASWEKYKMEIYKRLVQVGLSDPRVLRLIAKLKIPKNVHVEIKLVQ